MPTLPMPPFPDWLTNPAVRHEASDLWTKLPTEKDPAKSEEVLSRLISDRRMDRVWRELYEQRRSNHQPSEQYSNPAYVTNASVAARNRRLAAELCNKAGMVNEEARFLEAEAIILERRADPPADPRWNEQDRAVQYFLRHAYRNFIDRKPVFLSDLTAKMNKLREVAEGLHQQAATLQSLGKQSDAQKLEEIASDCDEEARDMLPRDGDDDPWVITRQSEDVELRAFVIDLSIGTTMLFQKELHSTLATVANVVFNRQDVTRSKVREMLRSVLSGAAGMTPISVIVAAESCARILKS